MRTLILIISLILASLVSCNVSDIQENHFSSSSDTLLLKTEKMKGFGVFWDQIGVGSPFFKDTTELPYPITFPNDIDDIKLQTIMIDFNPNAYLAYKRGEVDTAYIMDLIERHKIDTANLPSIQENTICMMIGLKGNIPVFIVDENNNKNFLDDSVRVYQKFNWANNEDLISIEYKIFDGENLIVDSSWLNVGKFRHDEIVYFSSHHITSSFTIGNDQYKISGFNNREDFSFNYPVLAIIEENGTKKDTVLEKEIIAGGEFLKLSNNYYKFSDITNNGSYITMVREDNFEDLIGTQIGMLAPDFSCVTVAGDTIHSSSLHDRILVIANSCGCGGDKESTEAFHEMRKEFGDLIHIIRVDNGMSTTPRNMIGWQVDTNNEFNSVIYNSYRNKYCSRNCFVIGKENRVIDKFQTWRWKDNMYNNIQNASNGHYIPQQ